MRMAHKCDLSWFLYVGIKIGDSTESVDFIEHFPEFHQNYDKIREISVLKLPNW